jgi:hypothetical protein
MQIQITPQTIKQPDILITELTIKIHTLNFGVDATFTVLLQCEDGNVITRQVLVAGDEYQQWQNDDNYIINLIGKKLGITI